MSSRFIYGYSQLKKQLNQKQSHSFVICIRATSEPLRAQGHAFLCATLAYVSAEEPCNLVVCLQNPLMAFFFVNRSLSKISLFLHNKRYVALFWIIYFHFAHKRFDQKYFGYSKMHNFAVKYTMTTKVEWDECSKRSTRDSDISSMCIARRIYSSTL